MKLVDRLLACQSDDYLEVRRRDDPDHPFTIRCRRYAGLRGFGLIPAGRKRPVAWPILSSQQIREWAAILEYAT